MTTSDRIPFTYYLIAPRNEWQTVAKECSLYYETVRVQQLKTNLVQTLTRPLPRPLLNPALPRPLDPPPLTVSTKGGESN